MTMKHWNMVGFPWWNKFLDLTIKSGSSSIVICISIGGLKMVIFGVFTQWTSQWEESGADKQIGDSQPSDVIGLW